METREKGSLFTFSSPPGRAFPCHMTVTGGWPGLAPWQAISLTVIEKVQIAAIVLGSLFLVASISWLIWSSLSPSAKWQRQDLLFQICYGMYGFMDVVCIERKGEVERDRNINEESESLICCLLHAPYSGD
ncbi:E3 ubiquitin-protein ligase MARCH9 [Myotis davidii]|uniref:E3 ubiquitin-protein ligase MARCH9 n=1 Tax=Myotis davidii TaxID=225400 RepID=L5LV87_MYODS|nr:E3 ubiquitin-protein ligase MARCH9 [Myotis davidii]